MWGTDGRSVRDVVVGGVVVVRDGLCTQIDEAALRVEAHAAQSALFAACGCTTATGLADRSGRIASRVEQEALVKIAVVTGPGAVELRNEPEPRVGNDELLVEVAACGLCTMERRLFLGEKPVYPVAPGHEVAGTVLAAGARCRCRDRRRSDRP